MGNKRFLTIAAFQRQTGLSYQTIRSALERGELNGLRTESGLWKIDTFSDSNPDLTALIARIDNQATMLAKLCQHLGVQ